MAIKRALYFTQRFFFASKFDVSKHSETGQVACPDFVSLGHFDSYAARQFSAYMILMPPVLSGLNLHFVSLFIQFC